MLSSGIKKTSKPIKKISLQRNKKGLQKTGTKEDIDYEAGLSPMEIRFNNGNTIYFAGGDDYENVKGTIDEDKLIKIVWFEELTGWDNSEDIEQIKTTFTRGNDDWFIAFYSFNPPKNKFDWVNEWSRR